MLKAKSPPVDQGKQIERPSIWKAPGILARLKEAETTLADLERRYKAAAPDSVLEGNSDALATIEGEIAKARANVARLTTAYAGALEADELEKRRQLAEALKSQIRVVRSHLGIADRAADAFAKALVEAIEQYKLIVEHRGKAKAACPAGYESSLRFDPGHCERGRIYQDVELEILRIGGILDPLTATSAFPGGSAKGAGTDYGRFRTQPELLPPFTDMLRNASGNLLAVLEGKPAE